jgi:hypothetical protein
MSDVLQKIMWTVVPTASGHVWGEMVCAHVGPEPCRVSIWSAPL